MSKISNFFKEHKYAIGIGVLALVFFAVNSYYVNNAKEILKKKAAIAEHNLNVANDSIRKVTEDGKISYQKLAYLTTSVSALAKLNEDLAAEVREIKGKVSTIVKADIKVKEIPVPFIVKAELLDSNVKASFNYDTTYSPGNYRKLSGYTNVDLKTGKSTGEKTTDELGIAIVTGIKDLDKGKPEIFFKSDYPGFNVSRLDGAVLDPKLFQPKKKIPLITPSLTIGWTPVTYDFSTKKTYVSLQQVGVNAGIGFNLFKIFGLKD